MEGSELWFQDPGGGTINQQSDAEIQSTPILKTHLPNLSNREHPMAIGENRGAAAGKGVANRALGKQPEGGSSNIPTLGLLPVAKHLVKINEEAGPFHRRREKELMEEMGTEEEKNVIIINMAKARGIVRARFLAVGIFISMLIVSTKLVVDSMKKIWKVRGIVDMCPLDGRRYVLEFAEEGDFNHITQGGPWRIRDDAVLIEPMKEGEDPEAVKFSSVPIWAQFKDIPFYLLSKELTRDLGRKWTPLMDEEVIVSIFYEWLPRLCRFCGIIGHQDAACHLPASQQKKRYGMEFGMPPTHYDDPRRWYLPETIGQARQQHLPALPGHLTYEQATTPNHCHQLAIVAQVAEEVNKLTV
ncbi:hypothetical protein ACQ4PT_057771 [Festuca glaucescens]